MLDGLRNTGVNAALVPGAPLNIPDAAGDPSAKLAVLIDFLALFTALPPRTMARAHRLAAYASGFVILYFLALFAIVPIPLIDANIAEQILPIVCIPFSPSVGQQF